MEYITKPELVALLLLPYIHTGWERKVHVTHSVDLYSGQILV